jgi:phosphoserine phosphatase
LPMMRIAGLSVAYRAKPAVRAEATLAIDTAGLDDLLGHFDESLEVTR